MKNTGRSLFALGVLFMTLLGVTDTALASVSMTPVIVYLSTEQPIAVLKVRNAGANKVLVEINVFEWTQVQRPEELSPTGKIVVSKPIFKLDVNEEIVIRIAVMGDFGRAEAHEATFRILVDQTDLGASQKRRRGVTLKIRQSLPVFVGAGSPQQLLAPEITLIQALGEALNLNVTNPNWGHIKINKVSLFTSEGALLETHHTGAYVLGGASTHLTVRTAPKIDNEAEKIQPEYAVVEYSDGRNRHNIFDKKVPVDRVSSINADSD